ncbi:MAG: histidine kinase [Bacteroidia bacterium]|nr:histidine kinase [Bacteroidia bacterium]
MQIDSVKYIITQVLIWGLGWLFVLLILDTGNEFDASFWRRAILMVVGTSIIVFVNLKWLLPLYFKKEKIAYFLATAAVLMFVVWGMHSDQLLWNLDKRNGLERIKEKKDPAAFEHANNRKVDGNFRWLVRNLPPLLISLLGSSLVAFSKLASEKEKELNHLEKAKLETEIKFLKSQINPHFLFNTLHNIYGLTIIQSDRAPDQLLKLSNILRYMLYESNEDKVPLKREVDYLKNYIELALLKDSRGMDVRFDLGIGYEGINVSPLLFIPFVENAFKHSKIEDLENGYVYISLKTSGNRLIFKVDNSKPQEAYKKDKIGGIGLRNIEQRLKLLYPDKHRLFITETEASFNIKLELDCA